MADELRRLYLEPTSRCNLNCAMCFRKSWVDEEAGDMDEATFRAVLAHLPPGVETLFFGGMGEPLFHPHITDMVRAASAAGLRTELVSNGSLLTEERSAALLDAGLDMLWLSVDSLEEADYAAIRCNGSLAVLKKNLAALKETGAVLRAGYAECLLRLTGTFDVIFCDPPYKMDCTAEVLGRIAARGLLAEGGVVVWESEREEEAPAGWEAVDRRSYGRTKIAFFGRTS